MNKSLLSLWVLVFSFAAFAGSAPEVNLSVLVDGSLSNPGTGTVTGFLSKPQQFKLVLPERPVGAMIGVSHYWSNTLTHTVKVGGNDVLVKILVSKTESNEGTAHWWGQVTFGNRIAAAVGGSELTGLRLMAIGAPVPLSGQRTFEPRAIVDFK